jgi:hypothetical protein
MQEQTRQRAVGGMAAGSAVTLLGRSRTAKPSL